MEHIGQRVSSMSTTGAREQSDVSVKKGRFAGLWESASSQHRSTDSQTKSSDRKSSGLRQFFHQARGGLDPSPDDEQPEDHDSDDLTNDAQGNQQTDRRRKQIYDAQKRHRQRKNDYVRDLEKEVSKLRAMDATVNAERHTLAEQNRQLREMLSQSNQGQPPGNDAVPFVLPVDSWTGSVVSVQHDDVMQHERLFIDQIQHERIRTRINDSTSPSLTSGWSSTTIETPRVDDSWLAVDFILALEWPCRHHVQHPITQTGSPPQPCGRDFGGHSMTTTAAVLAATSPRPTTQGLNATVLQKWQIPHTEIDKLVQLSDGLNIDDDLITPAQAYSATRARCEDPGQLRCTLDRLKPLLADVSHCEGLGAVIDAEAFHQHLEEVLQA